MKSSVSVIVITYNEEKNIYDCLNSVKWADEIVVVDSKSTDKTVDIAKSFTDKVYEKEWEGYAENKNFAFSKTTSEWILWLDADERVTNDLAQEIIKTINTDSDIDGYELARKAFFLGRWIKHCGWYPGYVLRVFKRENARFSDSRVHEGVVLKGTTARLNYDLLHFTDDSLEHYMWKFNRYTSLAADELALKNKSAGIGAIIGRPIFAFFKMYFLKKGFLDRIEGLMLCLLSAGYVAIKYAKLWEKSKKN